jgi:hypothetical protein
LTVQTQRAQPAEHSDRAHEVPRQVQEDAGRGAAWLARVGLAGRGIFYLVLVWITVQVALLGFASQQDDTNGALATITRPILGRVAVGVVALGFVCFGIESLLGGWRHGHASRGRRALEIGRGLFYLGLAYVPAAYLAGNHQVGSEQQQHRTAATLLGWPAGQELVALAGVVVIGICGAQIYSAIRRNPAEQMNLDAKPRWVDRMARIVAGLGIAARATVVLPVGVFLLVAAVEFDPNRAKGLDGELLTLARYGWGRVVLFAAAIGLLVFAIFSFLDALFHDFETD